MTDIQLKWYTMLTELEQEQVNIFIALHVAQSLNNISISIPVCARAQLDVEMLVNYTRLCIESLGTML